MLHRRDVLRSIALLPAGWAAAAGTARAFSLEPSAEDVSVLYHAANRCSRVNGYHAQILADVQTLLNGRELPAAEQEKIIAEMTCPICGCRVTEA